eukprot:5686462-Pyramimonas_sp.AAC.1
MEHPAHCRLVALGGSHHRSVLKTLILSVGWQKKKADFTFSQHCISIFALCRTCSSASRPHRRARGRRAHLSPTRATERGCVRRGALLGPRHRHP